LQLSASSSSSGPGYWVRLYTDLASSLNSLSESKNDADFITFRHFFAREGPAVGLGKETFGLLAFTFTPFFLFN
jgi:hypothetical protein